LFELIIVVLDLVQYLLGRNSCDQSTAPHSYIVEYKYGSHYHLHANKLRKFHVRVDDVECDSTMYATSDVLDQQDVNSNCAIIYKQDSDFGDVSVIGN